MFLAFLLLKVNPSTHAYEGGITFPPFFVIGHKFPCLVLASISDGIISMPEVEYKMSPFSRSVHMIKHTDIVVRMKFGSHLYGTATPDSDLDYKGVFLPSKEDILLGNIPKNYSFSTKVNGSKNNPDDIDVELYSLHYFIKLACEGQTVALDMLHAPETMIVERSDIWASIISEKHRFYSKNLKSFIDYARRQASKYGIKGSRLNTVARVLDLLKSEDPPNKLRVIWDKLPRMEHCYEAGRDPNGIRQYQICGKMFQETTAIGYMIPILQKFYDEYGSRARSAAQNRDIDWKALSHALRAAIQVKQIVTQNTITFPLKEAPFLMKVKDGKLDYLSEVAPVLESLMEEVEDLVSKSELPEKADVTYWNKFICETVEAKLFPQPGGSQPDDNQD